MNFPHTRLDAYQAAADFVVLADVLALGLPRGRAYLVDQLRRASLSIQANIAEGAGEFSPSDKARFYRMALRSASECAALLDACRRMQLCEREHVEQAEQMLDRVMAMLTKLVNRFVGGRVADTGIGIGIGIGSGMKRTRARTSVTPPPPPSTRTDTTR